MRYFEAPTPYPGGNDPTLFLAGGITGCPDWQAEVVEVLEKTDVTVFNPRRADFPIEDPTAAREQIAWEHEHLRKAHVILFWFPAEAIQPIALYELGAWSMTDKRIAVGTHPRYPRRLDVQIQTELVRPQQYVFENLMHTVGEALVELADYLPV